MQPTPTTPQLQILLSSRRKLEAEIANWQGISATATAKREAVISDPAALTDPALYDSASRFEQQAEERHAGRINWLKDCLHWLLP